MTKGRTINIDSAREKLNLHWRKTARLLDALDALEELFPPKEQPETKSIKLIAEKAVVKSGKGRRVDLAGTLLEVLRREGPSDMPSLTSKIKGQSTGSLRSCATRLVKAGKLQRKNVKGGNRRHGYTVVYSVK